MHVFGKYSTREEEGGDQEANMAQGEAGCCISLETPLVLFIHTSIHDALSVSDHLAQSVLTT